MAEVGAFAFGMVLGWFTYFTNRYRSGDIGLGDLAKLVGIIGGGAVTALFGEAKSALFGAYGMGLAVGFFSYFIALVWMVGHSDGAFTWTWFLDGRRKKPSDDETTEGAADTRFAMSMRPPEGSPDAPRAPLPAAVSLFGEAIALRDQAIDDSLRASVALTTRIARAPAGAKETLLQARADLTEQRNALLAMRLREAPEDDAARAAVEQLRAVGDALRTAPDEMEVARDASEATTRVIGGVRQVIGLLNRVFS